MKRFFDRFSDVLLKGLSALMIIIVLGVYLPGLIGLEIKFFSLALGFFLVVGIITNVVYWTYRLIKWISHKKEKTNV